MTSWRLLPFHQYGACENMAIDEALFEGQKRRKAPPTLRLYGWRSPALSLGYFQNAPQEMDLAACRTLGIEVVRRITGGKAVLHEDDVTYAVASDTGNPLFHPDITGTYRAISLCLARGLSLLGIRAELAPRLERPAADLLKASCFAFPSRHELLVGGRKICGSAQARGGGAFLQHGSLLLDFQPARTLAVMRIGRDRDEGVDDLRRTVTSVRAEGGDPVGHEDLCRALRCGFEAEMGIRFVEAGLTPWEEAFKDRLLGGKFADDRWNLEGKQTHGEYPETDPG